MILVHANGWYKCVWHEHADNWMIASKWKAKNRTMYVEGCSNKAYKN